MPSPERVQELLLHPERAPSRSTADDVAGRSVQLERASKIKPEEIDYFEDGLIPLRVVTLVTGLDGVGKSTFLYDRAARATRGQLPGLFDGTPADVAIASAEDHPASVIVPRLLAAGADLEHVHVVKVRRDGLDGDLAFPDDLDDVAARVCDVDARLLIVDPLVAAMPLNVDSHKPQHVRSVLAPLARLAEDAELAVCAVVHFNGAPSTDVRTRISGSKALRDASRSVLVCGPDPDDESRSVLVQDKFSFGPKATTGRGYRIEGASVEQDGKTFTTSKVVWLGEVTIDSRTLLAGAGDPEDRTERDEATDFLKAALAKGPRLAADVKAEAKAEGIMERTLHRARRGLDVVVQRDGTQRGRPSKWHLPDYVPLDSRHEPRGTKPDPAEAVTPQGIQGKSERAEPVTCHPRESGAKPADKAQLQRCEQCQDTPADLTIHGVLCDSCVRRVASGVS